MPVASRRGVLSTSKQTPSFRAAKLNNSGTGSQLTIPVPAETVVGDLMLAVIVFGFTSGGSPVTPPAGWALVDREPDTGDRCTGLYQRTASASEPASYQFTWTGGASQIKCGVIAVYAGPVNGTPIDDVALTQPTSSATSPVVASSVDTTGLAERLICVFVVQSIVTWTDPADMTRRFAGSPSGGSSSVLIVDKLMASPGATGTKTAIRSTSTSQVEAAVTVALNAA